MIKYMIPFRKSLGFRLLGISFILLALPLLVDSFILIQKRYQYAIAGAKSHLIDMAYLRELPLTELQPLNEPLLEVMSYFLDLQSDFPNEPNTELNEKLQRMAEIGEFSEIFILKITDEEEYIATASSSPNIVGRNYTDFFRLNNLLSANTLKRGFNIYIFYDETTFEPYVLLAHLIFSAEKKKVIGVLVVADDINFKLQKILQKTTQRFPVSFALLYPSTVVFAGTDPTLRFHYLLPLQPEYRQLFIQEAPFVEKLLPNEPIDVNNRIGYPFFEFFWQGEDQIGYIKKLPNVNFSLLTYAPKKKLLHAQPISFFNIYSIYALTLVIGGGVAYLLTMRMAKPIGNLSVVMQEISKGNIHFRYRKDWLGFEINVLGSIFNDMIDTLLEQKKIAEEDRVTRETLARELRLGQQIQQQLLAQKIPKYPGVDMAEKYIPAIEVGGDFYDVFIKERTEASSQLFFAVADASGKGSRACFYSLSVRNMLRIYAKEYDDVGMAMSATNNLFKLDAADTGMFVTVLMGMYDDDTKTFYYFSAGHNPPILRREDGSIEILRHHGIAMGVLETGKQQAHSIQLSKGDTLVLYTDGITEAQNEKFELYGEERLINLIRYEGFRSASELVESIVLQTKEFTGTASQHDDITLMVMKVIS